MSIFSNVTEQDLISLRKIAEQQKNQRALKVKNKILQQTHDVKLAESLTPITEKLDEVKETTQNLGDVFKKSKPGILQLAIENTQPQLLIEKNEVVIYDRDLEKTLKILENNNTGFFKTYHDPQRGWILNNYPKKMLRGTTLEIIDLSIT